jgi:hypothetical protein
MDHDPNEVQMIPPASQDNPTYNSDGTVSNNTSVLDLAKRAGDLFPGRDPREGGREYYDGALRHCTASCLLTRRYYRGGRLLRHGWDWVQESSGAADSITDMQAEDIGDFLADGEGSCAYRCTNAYPPRP